jgi:hypothetical protein
LPACRQASHQLIRLVRSCPHRSANSVRSRTVFFQTGIRCLLSRQVHTPFPLCSHPTAGLTLCTDFLTLKSVSARHATESVEVFPEFTITRPVVGGPVGADGVKLHWTGAFQSDPAR